MTTRAIIYTRISRDAEGEGEGVERQRIDCLARAEREGWEVVDVVEENDTSASTNSRKPRPKYDEMMARAERREFDVILAYSNSRLTRRPLEFEGLIGLHDRTGIRIATIVSGDDDLSTADGRLTARIKGNMDAAEAERTSERVKRALRARVEKGMTANGGVRPFGYDASRTDIVEHEADALRDAARRILAGESLVSVVASWNAAGLASVNGGRWSIRTLTGILKSPRIAGLVEHQDRIVGTAAWPAILPMGEWEALRAKLSNGTGEKLRTRSLLAGMLTCGGCGVAMTAHGPMYRCNRASGGCGKVSRNMGTLEAHVIGEWAKHMTEATGSEFFVSEIGQQDQAELTEKREEAKRRIETLRAHYAAGVIEDEDFFPVVEALRARMAEMDRKLATTPNRLSMGQLVRNAEAANVEFELGGNTGSLDNVYPGSIEVQAPWATVMGPGFMPASARREMLRRVIERVTVQPVKVRGSKTFDPSTVSIAWRA